MPAPVSTVASSTPQTPTKPEFDDTPALPWERRVDLVWQTHWRAPDFDDYDVDDPRFGQHQRNHVAFHNWFKAWNTKGAFCTLHPPKTVYCKGHHVPAKRILSADGKKYLAVEEAYCSPLPWLPPALADGCIPQAPNSTESRIHFADSLGITF
jgi:hypothetical protein